MTATVSEALAEYQITCPYCWEVYSLYLEAEATRVELIEDCQICCHPIQLRLEMGFDGEALLQVDRAM